LPVEIDAFVAAVRKRVADMRHELATEEAFLAELEKRVPGPPRGSESAANVLDTAMEQGRAAIQRATDVVEGSGLRRVSRKEKAGVARELIEARPGQWTTVELREALRAQGIDPDGGTPVKNIMFSFVHDDRWGKALGGGAYDFTEPFPQPARNGAVPSQEA
jgi:hypothetical protein